MQKWLDRKILKLIHAHKKLFLKFNLTMKFKILLGKKKVSSMKLILDKKQINIRNFGKR